MDSRDLYGGIEAGGTKFICVVGSDPANIVDRKRIETTSPGETLPRVIAFFEPYVDSGRMQALGIGSFGPIDLDRSSPNYGCITATPKRGWQNSNILAAMRSSLHVEVALDTDVNAAALGEATWGAGRGMDSLLYLTIGTGIGGGFILKGQALTGMSHPEMGHVRLPHDIQRDDFAGNCPFHAECFEGLASGPAIERRFGRRPESLPDGDPFWQIEAGYIGAALATYVLILSPARIILGGGIMQRQFLFPMIRRCLLDSLGGYVQSRPILEGIERYVSPPELGNDSGAFGALALARLELGGDLVE